MTVPSHPGQSGASQKYTVAALQPSQPLSPKSTQMNPLSPITSSSTGSSPMLEWPANNDQPVNQPSAAEKGRFSVESERNSETGEGKEREIVNGEGGVKQLWNLPGLRIPVHMYKSSQAQPDEGKTQANMISDCPLPAEKGVTTVTDPIVKVSWGPETAPMSAKGLKACHKRGKAFGTALHWGTGNSFNAGQIKSSKLKEARKIGGSPPWPGKVKPQSLEVQTAEDDTFDDSAIISPALFPRSKPPPPTPPELAYQHYSLSTPTLPAFHAISDPSLVNQFRAEREADPVAFDTLTKQLKRRSVADKVERGGKPRLEQGDYSVELASREDAAKAEKWATRRNATAGLEGWLDYQEPDVGLTQWLNAGGASQSAMTKSSTNAQCDNPIAKKATEAVLEPVEEGTNHTKTEALSNNTDSSNQSNTYTSSGSIRHQHSRITEETDAGHRIVIKTWIEITQEVNIPKHQSLEWIDAQEATKNKKDKEFSDSDSHSSCESFSDTESDSIENGDELEPSEGEVEELLAELSKIRAGGTAGDAMKVDGFSASMEQLRAQIAAKRKAWKLRME